MKIEFLMNDGTKTEIEDDFTEEEATQWLFLLSDDSNWLEVERVIGEQRVRGWTRARDVFRLIITDAVPIPPPKLVKGEENAD